MRGFIILCLVKLAFSTPPGYNYNELQHVSNVEYGSPSPLEFFKNFQALMDLQTAHIDSNSIEQFVPTQQEQSSTQSLAQQQYSSSNMPSTSNSFSTSTNDGTSTYLTQQQPIITKRFFMHSAPEEENEEVQHKHITLGKPRKNFNIVFIKSPMKSMQRTLLKISPALNEERTIIYVLGKKQDAQDIDAHVIEPVTTTAKPEVFFIKYKTHEEAEHVQRSIQSQYDSLGGSSQISNEGVAPVSSVIGALDSNNEKQYVAEEEAQQQHAAEDLLNSQIFQRQQVETEDMASTNNGYLPPILRKYRL